MKFWISSILLFNMLLIYPSVVLSEPVDDAAQVNAWFGSSTKHAFPLPEQINQRSPLLTKLGVYTRYDEENALTAVGELFRQADKNAEKYAKERRDLRIEATGIVHEILAEMVSSSLENSELEKKRKKKREKKTKQKERKALGQAQQVEPERSRKPKRENPFDRLVTTYDYLLHTAFHRNPESKVYDPKLKLYHKNGKRWDVCQKVKSSLSVSIDGKRYTVREEEVEGYALVHDENVVPIGLTEEAALWIYNSCSGINDNALLLATVYTHRTLESNPSLEPLIIKEEDGDGIICDVSPSRLFTLDANDQRMLIKDEARRVWREDPLDPSVFTRVGSPERFKYVCAHLASIKMASYVVQSCTDDVCYPLILPKEMWSRYKHQILRGKSKKDILFPLLFTNVFAERVLTKD